MSEKLEREYRNLELEARFYLENPFVNEGIDPEQINYRLFLARELYRFLERYEKIRECKIRLSLVVRDEIVIERNTRRAHREVLEMISNLNL